MKSFKALLISYYVALVFIPTVVFIGIAQYFVLHSIIEQSNSNTYVTAQSTAQLVQENVVDYTHAMNLIRNFSERLRQLGFAADLRTRQIAAQARLINASYGLFDTFYLLDTQGTVVASIPENPDTLGFDYSGLLPAELIDIGDIRFSDSYRAAGGSQIIMNVATNLGEQYALFELDLQRLSSLLQSILDTEVYSYVALTDESGKVIAHSDQAAVQERRNISNTPAFTQAAAGREGTFADDRGNYATVSRVPLTDWVLIISQSRENIFQGASTLNRILMLSFFAYMLLVTAVSYLLGRRILNPIRNLSRVTSTIVHADYNLQLQYSGIREIDNLMSNFTAMTEAIEERETRLLEAKSAAEDASKAKSEFLSNMSHEIRTPLNGVIGFTDMLMQTPLNNTQQEYCANTHTSGKALLAIINDILDFSKIEADKLELEIIESDIVKLAHESASIILHALQDKDIELLVHIQPDSARLAMVDPVRLQQILTNLLSNAVKFTEQGEIELQIAYTPIAETRGRYQFSVRDTGMGIEPQQQEKLFQAFSQGDSSTTRRFGGTGLGLIISNLLAEKMGSHIQLESTPGRGSSFFFSLETECRQDTSSANAPHHEVPPQPVPTPRPTPVPPQRVLIVDDNSTSRSILQQQLNHWNTASSACDNGLDALKMLDTHSFDTLIIDQQMPYLDGLKTIQKIRETQHITPEQLRIILLHSPMAGPDLPEASSRLGVHCTLSKPVHMDKLYRCLYSSQSEAQSPPAQTQPPANTGPDAAAATPAPRILVAEDTSVNMELVKAIIANAFPAAHVIEAADGKAAAQAAAEHQPDIILMDVQMPVMDGLEATRQIRAREQQTGIATPIPIIALTAGALKEEQQKALDSGMDDFLSKPIKPQQLRDGLKKHLQV